MVDMKNDLDGKVAFVTGSARNIGRAVSEELASASASLIINCVQAKELCEEVAEGTRSHGGKAIPFIADVRDPAAVQAMAEKATQEFGGIDILIHNAAVRTNTSFDELDLGTLHSKLL